MISVGITEYNFSNHVASDIGLGQKFVPAANLKSQNYIDNVQDWTISNKMKLNEKKTKLMIFNYTVNFQFTTRLHIEDTLLEIIQETMLLGVMITSNLSWHENTKMLIKRSYARMPILRKLYSFNIPIKDLVTIYIMYIRNILEQSCVVWHSSLTEEDKIKLERVQKASLRIIMGDTYLNYENALQELNLETLDQRRILCEKFAKSCLNSRGNQNEHPPHCTGVPRYNVPCLPGQTGYIRVVHNI